MLDPRVTITSVTPTPIAPNILHLSTWTDINFVSVLSFSILTSTPFIESHTNETHIIVVPAREKTTRRKKVLFYPICRKCGFFFVKIKHHVLRPPNSHRGQPSGPSMHAGRPSALYLWERPSNLCRIQPAWLRNFRWSTTPSQCSAHCSLVSAAAKGKTAIDNLWTVREGNALRKAICISWIFRIARAKHATPVVVYMWSNRVEAFFSVRIAPTGNKCGCLLVDWSR